MFNESNERDRSSQDGLETQGSEVGIVLLLREAAAVKTGEDFSKVLRRVNCTRVFAAGRRLGDSRGARGRDGGGGGKGGIVRIVGIVAGSKGG